MDRNQFFAELDQLTLSQIEARFPSWDSEQLKLVEEYLERGTIRPAQGAQSITQAESVAVAMATKANRIAAIALIIAIGAMFAAIAAGLVAFQALQHVAKGRIADGAPGLRLNLDESGFSARGNLAG